MRLLACYQWGVLQAIHSVSTPSISSIRRIGPVSKWALVVFCLVSIGVSGHQAFWCLSHGPMFSDLRIFTTGIDMVRSGERHELYNFEAQQRAQTRLYPETRVSGLLPFNHPAFELLFYWPISGFSYRMAFLLWALANVGLVLLIARLMAPVVPALVQATGIPLALYLLAFYPVIYVCGEGQDSLIFLLLLVLSMRSMNGGRTFLAGFLLAIACFKFHLVLGIAFFVLCLRGKWRGLAGLASGGAVVLGISLAIVGRAMLHDYPAMLRNQSVMTPWGFIPWFMPNLRGILQWTLGYLLDIGLILPIIFMSSAIVAVIATWLVLSNRTQPDETLTYSIAILTAILVSYHLHVQDLSMAILPMLVLADHGLRAWHRNALHESVVRDPASAEVSGPWTVVLAVTIGVLYVYRIAGELFPVLIFRGCLLAVPIFALWVVALRFWCAPSTSPVPQVRARVLGANLGLLRELTVSSPSTSARCATTTIRS